MPLRPEAYIFGRNRESRSCLKVVQIFTYLFVCLCVCYSLYIIFIYSPCSNGHSMAEDVQSYLYRTRNKEQTVETRRFSARKLGG
jgi:hypothetical protein